jgi:putative pyruvate formate lyase activating enzyme
MPDFKFWDPRWSERYCGVADYPVAAAEAVKAMHRQVGDLRVNAEGIAERGLLVRHLVMPNGVAGTAEIMEFIARGISLDTYVNVMDQYRPCGTAEQDEFIGRRVLASEYREAVRSAQSAGLHRLDSRDRPRLAFSR